MPVQKILLLGDKRLYEKSKVIPETELPEILKTAEDLRDTLQEFRATYQVGRAIAAPQIGIAKRLIYWHIPQPRVLINPVLTFSDEDMMEVWDDCMSFPNLLVRVLRHRRCRLTYFDEKWQEQQLDLTDDYSELLQHEYDHLDGILAVQRGIDDKSLALRETVYR